MHRRRAILASTAALLVAFLLALPVASARAVSSGDLAASRARADAARSAASAAQAKADRLVSESRAIQTRIDLTREQISQLSGRVDVVAARRARLEADIAKLRAGIAEKEAGILKAQAALNQQNALLGARASSVYRHGDLYWLELLLQSRNLNDLVACTTFVEHVMVEDTRIVKDLSVTRASLRAARAGLDRSLQALSQKRAEAAAEQNNLSGLQSEHLGKLSEERSAQGEKTSLLSETKANIARLKAAAAAEDAESARIQRMLKGASRGHGKFSGSLTWPAPGHEEVTSPFGWRMHPILKVRKFHSGIDIRAPYGARIVAVAAGKVVWAGDRGGYGNVVMIDHGDGLVSVYAHMSSIVVSDGQKVSRGVKIGEVGSTGLSTGPHLHFEVRVNGVPHDPMDYL